jgi:predicted nucleotidyltransferase
MRPLSNDLREFIRLLNTKNVRYVIVGAWALAFHGRPRYTGDLDIFVARDDENVDKLLAVMIDFGFGAAGITRDDLSRPDYVIQLGRAPNRIDLLTGISGVRFEDAWNSREPGDISGTAVNFLSRDLLITNKLAANRAKDRADVEVLQKTRPKAPSAK